MPETIQWFQYKFGVVGETQRVTHCARHTTADRVRSWCRREFAPTDVEEAAEPGATPEPGQVTPRGPCVPCLLLVTAATDRSTAQLPAHAALPHAHP